MAVKDDAGTITTSAVQTRATTHFGALSFGNICSLASQGWFSPVKVSYPNEFIHVSVFVSLSSPLTSNASSKVKTFFLLSWLLVSYKSYYFSSYYLSFAVATRGPNQVLGFCTGHYLHTWFKRKMFALNTLQSILQCLEHFFNVLQYINAKQKQHLMREEGEGRELKKNPSKMVNQNNRYLSLEEQCMNGRVKSGLPT